jgi:RecG-like helicase
MLMDINGDVGSGKTLLASKIAIENPNVPVRANYEIKIPNFKPLAVEDLLSLEATDTGTLVLIDEAYTWLESRVSMSKINRYMSYIVFQSRKRDLDIITTEQLRSSIDLRFKDMSNFTVFCFDRPKPKTSVADFKYRIIKGNKFKNLVYPFKKAKKLFELYDTKQVIMPPDIEELKADMIASNPTSLNKMVNDIVKDIKKCKPEIFKKEVKEVTHDFVNDLLLQLGKPLQYESFVYIRLRSQIQQLKGE